jgi:hypothetical protein
LILQQQRPIEDKAPKLRSKITDETPGELAKTANVAQFINLPPGPEEPVQELRRLARTIAQSW